MWKRIALGAIAATLGLTALVIAQTTPIYNLLGTETAVFTLGSGSSIPVPLNQIHNTQGSSSLGAATTVVASAAGNTGWLIARGSITTLDVSLPNPAYRGHQLYIVPATGTITTLRVSTQAGTLPGSQTDQSIVGVKQQQVLAGSAVGFMYNTTLNTWFRIQ